MPVMPCEKDGKRGFKYGESGVCFVGEDGRSKAEAVGRAVQAKEGDARGSMGLGINPPKPKRRRAV